MLERKQEDHPLVLLVVKGARPTHTAQERTLAGWPASRRLWNRRPGLPKLIRPLLKSARIRASRQGVPLGARSNLVLGEARG